MALVYVHCPECQSLDVVQYGVKISLHGGGVVTGTVYDDRIPVSSGYRWPLPRGVTPGQARITKRIEEVSR